MLNDKQQTEQEISHLKYMDNLFIRVTFAIANTTNAI